MQTRLLPALALVSLVGACSELVDLGSECPPHVSVCLDPPPPVEVPGPSVPGPTLDAGSAGTIDMLGERDDAQRPSDGGPAVDGNGEGSGAVATLPALFNRSFELTQGGPGDITTVSLPTFTSISPWYTCQAIGQGSTGPLSAVRAENTLDAGSAEAAGAIAATDARTFVSIRYFGNVLAVPLIQRLGAPMTRGTRYGLAADVRALSSSTHLSLQVKGGNDCLGITQQPEVLATTAPVTPGAWQRVCISFVPSATYNLIGLQAVSTSSLSDDILLVDNLREATDCP
ncbi:MAG: hypothetical protein ABW252_06730 [Polyangiales bacterium]